MTTFKHGEGHDNKTVEYRTWSGIKERCYNPNNHNFQRYGARGIVVCQRWKDDYRSFLADMGRRPVGTTLDRIDNDKGYEPSNCRWTSPKEQQRNRKNTVYMTVNGKRITAAEVAEAIGFHRNLVYVYLKVAKRIGEKYGV